MSKDIPANGGRGGSGRLESSDGVSVYVYDADGRDGEAELTSEAIASLRDDQLLWVDVQLSRDDNILAQIASRLGVADETLVAIRSDSLQPSLSNYEDSVHVRAVDVSDRGELQPTPVDCVVGANWVMSVHRHSDASHSSPLWDFNGETELGHLDGPSLLATLLEGLVGGYLAAIDETERQVDAFDDRALRNALAEDRSALSELVALRRRVATLRRFLVSHRGPFAALGDRDFIHLVTEESADRFRALLGRLERAIDAVESAREMVVGSFEILTARTAQRTNNIMKVLTLVSAALLPSALIAGVLGMNFRQSFFDYSDLFWVVVGFLGLLIASTLALARWRRWI